MNKIFLKMTLIAASALLASNAVADQMTVNNGIMIGVNGGYSKLQSPNKNIPDTTSPTNKNFHPIYGATIGYNLALNPNVWLGISADYNAGTQSKYSGTLNGSTDTIKIKQSDADVLLTAGFVADGGFNIYGQAGWAYVMQKTSGISSVSSTALTGGNGTRKQGRTKIGIGLGYMFVPNLNITLGYQHIFGKTYAGFPLANKTIISNSTVKLGINYTIPVG